MPVIWTLASILVRAYLTRSLSGSSIRLLASRMAMKSTKLSTLKSRKNNFIAFGLIVLEKKIQTLNEFLTNNKMNETKHLF